MPEPQQPGAEKPSPKGFSLPEVTKDGTRFFRATSFELFARPTPRMILMSLVGTGIFAGILGNFYLEKRRLEKVRTTGSMSDTANAERAKALRLLQDARAQVSEVERHSKDLLELIAGGCASPDFVHQVLRSSDKLQAAARKADGGYKQAVSLVPSKAHEGLTFDMRRQQAEQALAAQHQTAGAATLADVVDGVQDISGLEVVCVAHPPSAGDLVETPVPSKGVMRAAVGLAGKGLLSPITVAVFGPCEAGAGKDAWGTSEYLVFRHISAIAMRVLKHYQEQGQRDGAPKGEAVQHLLLWLCLYRDLFNKPCDALKTLLVADSSTRQMIPPIFRPYRSTWEELQAAAAGRPSAAYHMQSAPTAVL